MIRAIRSFLAREWPLVAAALAIASLALVPRFVRSEKRSGERDLLRIAELRRLVDDDPEKAGLQLRAFLKDRTGSVHAAEARYLLGRVVVLRVEHGEFPGLPTLNEAWEALVAARASGFERDRCASLQQTIVRLLDERDYATEAVDRARELVHSTALRDARLDLARALAKRAAREPELRPSLLVEADSLVSDYLRSSSADRVPGFLTQADVFARAGQYQEELAWIDRALAGDLRSDDRARLLLERAKALLRLNRIDDARGAATDAEKLAVATNVHDRALLLLAIFDERSRSGDCRKDCERLIRAQSSVAPVARLVLGLCELENRSSSDPIATIAAGLGAIRHPAIFEETGFDFGDLYARVRLVSENDRHERSRVAPLYRDFTRLFPASAEIAFDHARLLEREGEFAKAADRLAAASTSLSDPAARERALREAAEACRSGALYLRAASLYRRYYDLRPRENMDGLYAQADTLRLAGCFPDALSVYSEFVSHARSSDPLVPRALLHRGVMLSKLGSRDEAVREFDRILSGELGIGPTSDEWAEALLGRGRALGERGRADLREYVERYSARFDYRARVAEAGLLLARAAIREGDWPAALDVLARIDPLSDQAPEIRQEIRSLKGDVLLGQGRWDEAAIAYDQAYRADLTSDERLWCLLGRARAFLRLGRREDARRDYENGRALYENRREAFDRSLAMHGKDVWGTTLETIERELQ